ncbi:MAG: hypothetical protein JXB32_05435 [Deltaproteobacteria bacterium]|nr:hypothetical protein [Deltaproteobacteria bacterium]
MSTNRGRSLSERLDCDGPESAVRRARELGGDAPEIARDFVTLHEKFGSLRTLGQPADAPPDAVDEVVSKLVERVAAAGEGDEVSAWRRPAFPQTEEETKAMGDEETTGQPGGESKESSSEPSAAAAEGAAPAAAPAVKRAKEAAPTDSGVVNLKALAEDYYKAKAARAEVVAKPAAGAAAAGTAAVPPERRRAMGPLLAIAAGLVAVFGVVLYLFLRGHTEDERTKAPPAGPLVASGPALMADESKLPPPQLEAPPPNATAEELERYRLEVEQLKLQLAEQQEAEATSEPVAVAPEAPAEAAPTAAPAESTAGPTTPRRTTGGSSGSPGGTSRPSTTGGTGTTSAAASGGTQPEAPVANPLINMLGGRTPSETTSGTGTSSGSTTPASGSTATGDTATGDTRLAGSLTDLGLTAPPRETTTPSTPTATTPAAPAAVAPPPPPPPPEETLPETLGRPEIRRGTDQVKSSVLRCGEGQTGTITVEFTVNGNDGSVNGTRVTGEFGGTAVGACAESAARSASFARFRRSTFTFTFPFVLPVQ